MTDYILNGDLYVRIQPKEETKIEYLRNLSGGEFHFFNSSQVIYFEDKEKIEQLPKYVLELLQLIGLIKINTIKDYKVLGLYQVFGTTKSIYMINKKQVEKVSNIKEEFIRLEEFIHRSFYINRFLVNNSSHLPDFLLLYEYANLYLIKEQKTGIYTILSKEDKMFQNYTIGDICIEYYEKEQVYQSMVEQNLKINPENPKHML